MEGAGLPSTDYGDGEADGRMADDDSGDPTVKRADWQIGRTPVE